MNIEEFVAGLKEERDVLLASYTDGGTSNRVAEQLTAAALTEGQRRKVVGALDATLTDAFYTVLLVLDGASSLNGTQQAYQIADEQGNVVSSGDGKLEALAFKHFQTEV